MRLMSAVALPPQSRFATGDEARLSSLVQSELTPLRDELKEIRLALNQRSGPRFQETEESAESSSSAEDEDRRKKHKDKWSNLGVPPRLIQSLEDLVEAFKQRPPPGVGSNKPYVDPTLAASTSPDAVAEMITRAFERGPPVQPALMQQMFDRWHQQQSAMNYLQQTKPEWIQSALPAGMAGNIVPVPPPGWPNMTPSQPQIDWGPQHPITPQQNGIGFMTPMQPSQFISSLLAQAH